MWLIGKKKNTILANESKLKGLSLYNTEFNPWVKPFH